MNIKYSALIIFTILIIPTSIIGMEDDKKDEDQITITRSSFGGGNGTLEEPFLISDYTQLVELSLNGSAFSSHFLLTNDIDASESNDGGSGFDPIGSSEFPFTGSFNGDNYSISNLWINRGGEEYIGLFAKIIDGNVTNLILEDITIVGRAEVGSISGWMENTWIINCESDGTLTASWNMGGIVGVAHVGGNKIIECGSAVSISFNNLGNMHQIGGLVGYFNGGEISNCSWDGNDLEINIPRTSVRHVYEIGGLVGELLEANLIDCHSEGKITIKGLGHTYRIGGLVGYTIGSSIDRSYSEVAIDIIFDIDTGTIYNIYEIGGLVGYSNGMIKNSYWEGSILYEVIITILSTGSTNKMNIFKIGGLVGYNAGTIQDCYSTTILDLVGHISYIGGLVGENRKEITGSYTRSGSVAIIESNYIGYTYSPQYRWDYYTYGIGGLIGRNDRGKIENCQSSGKLTITSTSNTVYLIGGLIGWDESGSILYCDSSVDLSLETSGYSVQYAGGLVGYKYGTSSGRVTNCRSSGSIDIDMIGSSAYYIGGLMGYSKQISVTDSGSSTTIVIHGSGRIQSIGGLIGQNFKKISRCNSQGSIDVSTSYVSGGDEIWGVGGLIGVNYDVIEDSKSDVPIRFKFSSPSSQEINAVGGLIGYHKSGTVDRCFSIASISAANDHIFDSDYKAYSLGGLVGENHAGIKNSYSQGSISVTKIGVGQRLGGLVGHNFNKIEQCYSEISFSFIGTTEAYIGGLVGFNSGGGSIFDCYAVIEDRDPTDSINVGGFAGRNDGTISNCFHDIEVSELDKDLISGNIDDDQINGTTTTEMMKRVTYTDAGWDFNTDNGWGIIEGETYPWLFSIYHRPIIEITNMEINGLLQTLEDDELIIEYTITYSDYPPNIGKEKRVFETSASWLSDAFNDPTMSGRIRGTPINDHVGDFTFELSTKDSANNWTYLSVDIEVINVNDNPQIINDDVTTAVEDEEYRYTYYAIDVDPFLTEFNWTLQTNAIWLKIDSNSIFCVVYGTPRGVFIGDWYVNITVFDAQGGYEFTNFTLTVESSNDAPVITTVPVPIAIEDELYVLDLEAEDEDDLDTDLTWKLVYGPTWLLSTRFQIRGTPTNDDIGRSWVEIRVTDFEGAFDEIGFILEVKNANDAPDWFYFPDDQNITEGEILLLDALARDIDLGDTLTYDIISDPPSTITVNPDSGAIKWLDPQPGNYSVNVSVSDGKVQIWRVFNIVVNEIPEIMVPDNIVPIMDNITDQVIDEGKTLVVHLNASDADGDPLFFSVIDGPEGMVISSDGKLVWTPFEDDIGNHTIEVSVSDGNGSVSKQFNIWVKDVPESTTQDPTNGETNGDEKNMGLIIVIIVLAVLLLLMIILFFLFAFRKKEKKEPEGKEEKKEEEKPDDMLTNLKLEKEEKKKPKEKEPKLQSKSEPLQLSPAKVDETKGKNLLPAPKPVEPEVGALPPSKEDEIAMAPEPKMEEEVRSEEDKDAAVDKEAPKEEQSSTGKTPEPIKTEEKAEKLGLPAPKLDD